MGAEKAFEALQRLLDLDPVHSEISEDNAETIQVRLADADIAVSIDLAFDAHKVGATVQIDSEIVSSHIVIEAHHDGWSVGEEPGEVVFSPLKPRYENEEIKHRVPRGSIVATFSKASWGQPWVGWSIETFARWIKLTGSLMAAEALLAAAPARVALHTWRDPTVNLGPFLSVGGVDAVAPTDATPRWPEPQPEWLLRTALISTKGCDVVISAALNHAVQSAALRLFAEETLPQSDGRTLVVVDRRADRQYLTERAGVVSTESCRVFQELVNWVLEEPTRTRLVVVRRVLGQLVPDPDRPPDSEVLKREARVAYSAAVDEQVLRALSAQASFENHIADFSARLDESARTLDKVMDEVVVKTLAALLAILVSSVIAKDVRGWPVLAASAGVALYVGWVAWAVLGGVKADAVRHRDLLTASLSGRPREVIAEARSRATGIVQTVTSRICWRQVMLSALVVAILVVGVALFLFVDASTTATGPSGSLPLSPTPVRLP